MVCCCGLPHLRGRMKEYKKKNINYTQKYNNKTYEAPKEKRAMTPEDIDKWLKKHQNIEYPKRGKKNTIENNRRR